MVFFNDMGTVPTSLAGVDPLMVVPPQPEVAADEEGRPDDHASKKL